jgi:DNA polymerase III alpha subunit
MDIDIDFGDRSKILDIIQHIPAAIIDNDGKVKKHNTGIYVQQIPINPYTETSNIDYKIAEDRGYFKLDFLNVNLYKDIDDEEHLVRLMNQEPIWELLEQKEFVDQLFHIKGYSNILGIMKPKNIEQLAAVLAIIRPAKKHLLGKNWDDVLKEVWEKPVTDEYYFKKSHSFSYAMLIIVQMNLICEQLEKSTNTFD